MCRRWSDAVRRCSASTAKADALAAFEAAVAADPSQTDLARRVEVLRFRTVEQGLARARDAAKAGRLDEANQAYHGGHRQLA